MMRKNRKIKPYELALPGYFYQTAKFANKILEVDWTDYFMPSTFKYTGRYELLGTCPLPRRYPECCLDDPLAVQRDHHADLSRLHHER